MASSQGGGVKVSLLPDLRFCCTPLPSPPFALAFLYLPFVLRSHCGLPSAGADRYYCRPPQMAPLSDPPQFSS
ncbi:hypothetical protein HPP92_027683 [Vanilla planifolia]|uniref:Uncharacterized protein n=1 Tax=Vanilla planifolia TaxID=51239 RepID=A0A835PC44_VANPL|nr:hypothetical protein HPP92_027683 [Vanilla planifolia]KAG0448803.1 hypothetical protein HPP92_027651 [Vanilla planifolia]